MTRNQMTSTQLAEVGRLFEPHEASCLIGAKISYGECVRLARQSKWVVKLVVDLCRRLTIAEYNFERAKNPDAFHRERHKFWYGPVLSDDKTGIDESHRVAVNLLRDPGQIGRSRHVEILLQVESNADGRVERLSIRTADGSALSIVPEATNSISVRPIDVRSR